MALTSDAHAALIAAVRAGLAEQATHTARLLRELAAGPLGNQDGFTALIAAAGMIEDAARMLGAADTTRRSID